MTGTQAQAGTGAGTLMLPQVTTRTGSLQHWLSSGIDKGGLRLWGKVSLGASDSEGSASRLDHDDSLHGEEGAKSSALVRLRQHMGMVLG